MSTWAATREWRYFIYVGAILNPSDPSGPTVVGGGLRLMHGADADQIEQFQAPGDPGAHSVVSVHRGIVTLRTQSGSTITFSLASDTFGG